MWGYTAVNGPHTWATTYKDAAGQKQSPINIATETAVSKMLLNKLQWNFKPDIYRMVNSGHSWKASPMSNIMGGPLDQKYIFDHLHCHWGKMDNEGSEHTINGKCFAAEIHYVFLNANYKTFYEAVEHSDGIAVLALLFEQSYENQCLQPIIHAISKIQYKNDHIILKNPWNPADLLPQNKLVNYWTYEGSLTTPPCYESVTWIILQDVQHISSHQVMQILMTKLTAILQQLNAFRTLLCQEFGNEIANTRIEHNFRLPMPLGNRIVYHIKA